MAGRRARAGDDLLHSRHFAGGVTAGKDLRVSKEDGSGIRPGIFQMLFKGGPARQTAGADTRMGRSEGVRPGTGQPLFRGGPARGVASEDLRMHHDGEDGIRPANYEPLADGGEAFSAEEKLAAHECMSAFKSGDPVKLLKSLKGLFLLFDSDAGPDAGDEGELHDDGE